MSCTNDNALLRSVAGNPLISCPILSLVGMCVRNCTRNVAACCSSCSAACEAWTAPVPGAPVPFGTTGERILGVANGYQKCLGVPDHATARANGCVFVTASCTGSCPNAPPEVPCDGSPHEVTNYFARAGLNVLCGHPHESLPGDGLVITFSSPLIERTLDATDLRVTLSDGSQVTPLCATLVPAHEPNEMETALTIGHYNPAGAYPVRIDVVGEVLMQPATPGSPLVDANGMSYSGNMSYANGVVLLRARYEALDASGESEAHPVFTARYPNGCGALYPTATHRISLLFSGGVTSDGWHEFLPQKESSPVVPLDATGAPIDFLGLADLANYIPTPNCADTYVGGDGDNYVDICLRAGADEPPPAKVLVKCADVGVSITPPKGSAYACQSSYTVDVTMVGSAAPFWTATTIGAVAGGTAAGLLLLTLLAMRWRRRRPARAPATGAGVKA